MNTNRANAKCVAANCLREFSGFLKFPSIALMFIFSTSNVKQEMNAEKSKCLVSQPQYLFCLYFLYFKNSESFHISAQNIDCRYSLKQPRCAVLTSTHNP